MFALRFLLVVLAIALVFGKNTSAKKAEKKAAAMTTTEILKAKTAKVAAKAIKVEAAAASSSSSSSKKSSSKSAKMTSELVDKRAYMETFLKVRICQCRFSLDGGRLSSFDKMKIPEVFYSIHFFALRTGHWRPRGVRPVCGYQDVGRQGLRTHRP